MLTLSKFSAFSFLSGIVCLTYTTIANAIPHPVNTELTQVYRPAPSQLIEQYTDHFFYQVNPELQGRKLTSTDREYIREWENLRAVIVPMIRPSQEVCPLEKYDVGWDFDLDGMPNSYSSVFDYLADIIFYNRYPQLIGKKLSPGTSEAKEWSVIRERLFVSTCGI
jgi:hypothetical protein